MKKQKNLRVKTPTGDTAYYTKVFYDNKWYFHRMDKPFVHDDKVSSFATLEDLDAWIKDFIEGCSDNWKFLWVEESDKWLS